MLAYFYLAVYLGLAAGGLVVPGYVALQLTDPLSLAITLLAALITYLIVKVIASFAIIYGRRQTIIMILTGYLIAGLFDLFIGNLVNWADLQMDSRRRQCTSTSWRSRVDGNDVGHGEQHHWLYYPGAYCYLV